VFILNNLKVTVEDKEDNEYPRKQINYFISQMDNLNSEKLDEIKTDSFISHFKYKLKEINNDYCEKYDLSIEDQ
jgi:hypothetical protein